MIACAQFNDLLQESIEGELTAPMRAEFERHMTECASCVALMKSSLRSKAMVEAAYPPSDDPTSPLPEPLVRSILAYVRRAAAATGSDAASGVA